VTESIGLDAHEPLHITRVSGDGIELRGVTPSSLVSIALRSDEPSTRLDVERGLGSALPDIGIVSDCEIADGATLLGLQADQWFLRMPAIDDPVLAVRAIVGSTVALTDQSDAWVSLAIDGPRATFALERVCRLDLHIDAFPAGRVARTAMEHLAVIVVRESENRFLLSSPRSSATSFAHAMETSVRYVS